MPMITSVPRAAIVWTDTPSMIAFGAAACSAFLMRSNASFTSERFVRFNSTRPTSDLCEMAAEEAYRQRVAVFPGVQRAARAVALMRRWHERREGLPDIL